MSFVNPMDPLLEEFVANANRLGGVAAQTILMAKLCASPRASAEKWQRVASGMIRAGFAVFAIELLNAAIARFTHDHELRYWRGNARRLSAQPADAESDFREVLLNVPQHHDAALSLAYMLREQGRTQAASEVMIASLNARKENVDETVSALIFLRECGQQARAYGIAQAGVARWPQSADVASLAAEFALAIGEFNIAREYLQRTLDNDPAKSASWLRLAYCQRYRHRADPDLRRIQHAWNDNSLDLQSRMCAGFALGKALDDLGDYAQAAAILIEANAMARANVPWRADIWRELVERRLVERSLPRVDAASDFAPIFVVGLPRTGTTLVATLLGRDEQLRERGELNWIPAMYEHLAEQGKLYDRAALSKVAQFVTAQMRRDDTPAHWYLDKNPLNFRYLDFIAALFPQARIIHCRRNLRDTALSLWTQHFAHADLGFCYDFSSIAQFAHGHDRLMSHWREVLEVPILALEYEAVATDAGSALGGIAKSLGLSAPPSTPNASAMPRTIVTASVWQARQPVYTRSIDRWKNYAAYLPEIERLF